jgi:hypothetical protein
MTHAWTALMHMEHGWFARHQRTTVAIVFLLITITPGVIECVFS